MSLAAETQVVARGPAARKAGADRRSAARLAVSIEFLDPHAWDRLAATFDGVMQEQLYTYAETRWPAAKPEALLFRFGDEVVGGTLMMIQPLPLGLGSIAVCKWGPIFRDATRPDAPAIYSAMIDALAAEYATRRKMMLSVLPRAATAKRNWQYELLEPRRFKRSATLLFPNRYIVNLRLSDDEQKASFHQKWRYHLNKAEKSGLTFERAAPERLGEFDALYQAMTDRKNFPDHSAYATIPALFNAEAPEVRPELFFVRHEGEVVAGAIIFKAGDTAVYLFGATNDKALPLRAGYFLHREAIRWLRDNTAAKWYDLGGTDGFQGLHQFKKGMVGSRGIVSFVPPVANYSPYRLPMLFGTLAFEGRELVHHLRRRLDYAFGGKARPDQQRAGTASEKAD
jgi:hypothetical protein